MNDSSWRKVALHKTEALQLGKVLTVNRSLWRKVALHSGVELMLTAILLFGITTIVRFIVGPSPISRAIPDIHVQLLIVGTAVALLLAGLIVSPAGKISGGHMNPAITFAMWRFAVFPAAEVIPYIAALLLGSVLGVLAARAIWGESIERAPVLYALIQPAATWSAASLFAAELVCTAVIVFAVGYFLTRPRLAPLVPWLVGALIGLGITVLGNQTGGSLNPARQFGPAVVSGHTERLWLFLLAPMLGAEIAARLLRPLQKRSQMLTHRLCGTFKQKGLAENNQSEVVLASHRAPASHTLIRCSGSAIHHLELVAILLAVSVGAVAQTVDANTSNVNSAPPPYKTLTQDEDWTYFRDSSRQSDWLDSIKYIRLGDTAYLSLGGEIRERYEMEDYPWWGQGPGGPDHNGYSLQRYLLHADFHLGERVRFFVQFQSSLEFGRNGGPRPVSDRDNLDLEEAFMEVNARPTAKSTLRVRIGRQELSFGSQRLVGVREEPNVRRSFDGVRLTLGLHHWQIDSFATKLVLAKPGIFDNLPDPKTTFWGVYAVRPWRVLPHGTIDVYYLGLDRKDANFARGTGNELRHSIGTRVSGETVAWDYNYETVFQWGSFGSGHIRAWTVASDNGYTLTNVRFRPRLGVRADVTSGDGDPKAPTLRTFNPLFPKGSYFGEIALISPLNHIDLHPSVEFRVAKNWTITPACIFFWRESLDDGIYRPPTTLIRSAGTSRSRYVGTQPSIQVEWQINRHASWTANYTHFFAGQFLRDTQPAKDVNYITTWITYRF